MTLRLDGALYRKFCVVAAVALFFTNFANFAERWGLIPLYWIMALCALTAPLLAGAALTERLPIRPLMIWCAAFLLISIVWYFPSRQDEWSFQEVQTRILSVTFILLMLFLFARPDDQRLARGAVVWATLLGIGLNIYEVFNPLTFSKIPGRSSGLFENSNQSGAGIMLGMILGYGVVPPRLRIPFVALCGVGIVTTFTRSAMLGWILVVVFLIARAGISVRHIRTIVIFTALSLGFVFSPLWTDLDKSLEKSGVLEMSNLQRLAFFSNGTTGDDSANERKMIVKAGWEAYKQHPLAGYGTGSFRTQTGYPQATHNIYVAMLIDHGILGLFIVHSLLFAAIYGANWKTIEVTGPLILFITMWGFFSHNVLDERYIFLAIALTAAMVTSARTSRADRQERPITARLAVPGGAMARA